MIKILARKNIGFISHQIKLSADNQRKVILDYSDSKIRCTLLVLTKKVFMLRNVSLLYDTMPK